MDRVELKLSRTRRSLVNYVALIAVIIFLLVVFQMSMPPLSEAQQAPNVQVQLSQPLGSEEDISVCVLYVSPDGADNNYGEADRITGINILDTNQVNPVVFTFRFYAPPDAETERYFKTTFIDTSGNESQPSAPIVFRVDKLPPGVPVGLTATEVQLSQ